MLGRLRREIVELGEPSKFKLSASLQHLGDGLGSVDSSEVRTSLLDTISAVIIEQPHKIPLLAGSIQIANVKSDIFGLVVVQMVHSKIQQFVKTGDYPKLKNFIRFLVCLAPMIEGEGVATLLEQLANKATELQNSEPERSSTAQEVIASILLTLPVWMNSVGPTASNITTVNNILNLCNQFDIKTSTMKDLLTPFVNDDDDDDNSISDTREYICLVRNAVQAVSSSEWKTEKLIGVSSMISLLMKEEQLENCKKHSFPAVDLPDILVPTSDSSLYKYPRLVLQVYLPTTLETTPRVDSYEGVLLRDIATDIILNMDFNRREVTRQLITLDLFFSTVAFAEPGISLERLQNLEEGKSTWKVEDTALEVVLENLFRLPFLSQPQVYYHTILIEACIMAPQAIAPVFGRAIRFFYNHIESFDLELIFRLMEWFSHHLNNFGFTWKWQEWKQDINLDDFHPKKVFMQQLVLKEMRLSYRQRIRDTLPDELVSLIPSVPEEPMFTYLDEDSGIDDLVQALIVGIRESKPLEDMQALVEPIREKITEQSVGAMADVLDRKLIDVLFSTVCHLGSRSLTHADSWVSKTADFIKLYVNSKLDRQYAISSVVTFWVSQPMVGLLVVRIFIKYGVLDNNDLVDYILDPSTRLLFTAHGWETLLSVLDNYASDIEKLSIKQQSETQKIQDIDENSQEKQSAQVKENSQEEQIVNNDNDENVKHAKTMFVLLLTTLSTGIYKNESSEWKLWWFVRAARSFIRKYHAIFASLDGSHIGSLHPRIQHLLSAAAPPPPPPPQSNNVTRPDNMDI